MARYLWPELAAVPHEIGYVDAVGVRTRFLRAGDPSRRALLLLHGFGSHLETFVRNVAALAKRWLVVAIDMLGHGFTEAPTRPYEVRDYVEHARAALAALGVRRCGLVGVALGSWVAARLAIESPREVESLTLSAPTGLSADPATMEKVRALSLAAVEGPTPEKARARLGAVLTEPGLVPEDLVENRLDVLAQPHALAATQNVLALQEMEYRPRNLLREEELARVTAPTLVVSGDADLLSPPAVGDRFAAAIPGARRLLVAGGGHWLHFERPKEFDIAQQELEGELR
jgi:2-hydroxy-6-oxonona-2,4-dienedioate hydrolase